MHYPHVRALSRGLRLLAILSRVGPASPRELSKASGIDRATVYRLLDTLCADDYVVRTGDGGYRLGAAMHQLSSGYTQSDLVAQIVAPELKKLLPKVRWPTDYAEYFGNEVVVRESTHPGSILSIYRGVANQSRSLLHTALGRAILCSASSKLREEMLRIEYAKHPEEVPGWAGHERIDDILSDFAERGYAWHIGSLDGPMSAIALPVKYLGEVLGAINLIYFTSSMTTEEAARRYLSHLHETISAIEAKLAETCNSVQVC